MAQTQLDSFAGRVVIGVDGSEQSHDAVHWGAAYAALLGCEATLLHTWEMPVGSVRGLGYDSRVIEDAREGAQAILDEAARVLHEAQPDLVGHTALVPGGSVHALLGGKEFVAAIPGHRLVRPVAGQGNRDLLARKLANAIRGERGGIGKRFVERGRQRTIRRTADEDVDRRGVLTPAAGDVAPVAQLVGAEFERDDLRIARRQADARAGRNHAW